MDFDFDLTTDRRGTLSYKWDIAEGELPMWVADMDFLAPEPVRREIMRVAEHGIYGYSYTPDAYFEAVRSYFSRRHGWDFDTEWAVYSNGVVAAISSMVRKLTTPGENVLIQAPVYNIFYNSIRNNGRNILSSDLIYRDGRYEMDFSDLEEKLADKQTSLMILCNPHNPVGRIWSREELLRVAELCHRYGVTVISDEIHCDLTRPGLDYIPFATVSDIAADISVTAVAPSKTFNMAGLQSALLIAKNPHLRHKVWRGVNTDEVGEPNAFSMGAGIAAFTECDEWVDGLREYIFENRRVAEEFIGESLPALHAVKADATYLLWVDISAVSDDSVKFCRALREKTGLYLSDGAEYGECGGCFVRINLATQRERVLDGLGRLKSFLAR